MAVAIRAVTRVQDADDAPSLGAGQNGYALTWNNATGAFVATALVTDHGALGGLSDDDHTGYALLAGRAGGQTLYGGTGANDDITIHGTSNATRTTSYVILQPTAGNVGIGTTTPAAKLHVKGAWPITIFERDASTNSKAGTIIHLAKSTSNMADGFGPEINFAIEDDANVTNYIAKLGAIRDGADDSGKLFFDVKNAGSTVEAMVINKSGNVGIGTTAPSTLLHVVSTTATTNAVRDVLTLGANVTSTGVGAAGLGAAVLFMMETSTTVDTSAASVQAIWYEATHATRKGDLVLNAYDTAIREGLRIRANGSAPTLGVLGATPIARKAHVADPAGGATVDAEARSAINAILASLEDFGFHATS